jgi:ATP-dependent Clp protease ATP-binding subunit ClpC
MTSNLGSQHIQKMQSIGFSDNTASQDYTDIKKKVMSSLKDFFRPEFLNRLDDNIIFDTLNTEVIADIVEKQLAGVTDRLLTKGINVSYSKKLIKHLAEKGFDPQYGARPLKR